MMLRPVSTFTSFPSPMLAGVSAFSARPANAAAFSTFAGQISLHAPAVSGRDATSVMSRRFAASSEIYLAMSPASSGGAGSAGGAGAPPASGGGDGSDPKAKAQIQRWIADLSNEDVEVRLEAAIALGGIGPAAEAAVPALRRALKDEDCMLRSLAAEALGEIGPKASAAAPMLFRTLTDMEDDVCEAAAGALRKMGPAVDDAFIAALNHKDRHVRKAAMEWHKQDFS